MLRNIILILALIGYLFGNVSYSFEIKNTSVSMVKLIISPKKFEEKEIIVSGFLLVKHTQVPVLYFSKESFFSKSTDYIILNDFPEKSEVRAINECGEGCYVSVYGKYEYSKYASPDDIAGFLEDISLIDFHDVSFEVMGKTDVRPIGK